MTQYEGSLARLQAIHEGLKQTRAHMDADFKREIAIEQGNIASERFDYMRDILAKMDARIEKQKAFFDTIDVAMTQEELHTFTGGFKDEEWTVGHKRQGRYS